MKKLDVKTPSDLVKPEQPEILHGKLVEVTPEPDWQKLGTLTIGESLGRFFQAIGSAVSTTIEVISNVQKIVAGAKWVAIVLGLLIVVYLIIRFI